MTSKMYGIREVTTGMIVRFRCDDRDTYTGLVDEITRDQKLAKVFLYDTFFCMIQNILYDTGAVSDPQRF